MALWVGVAETCWRTLKERERRERCPIAATGSRGHDTPAEPQVTRNSRLHDSTHLFIASSSTMMSKSSRPVSYVQCERIDSRMNLLGMFASAPIYDVATNSTKLLDLRRVLHQRVSKFLCRWLHRRLSRIPKGELQSH